MNNAGAMAAGITVGYLLGRTKKMKLALMIGTAVAARQVQGSALVEQGKKMLDASPGLQRIGGDARGRLVDTGKKAVVAAAGKGIDALSTKLEDRADRLRPAESKDDDEAGDDETDDADETDADETAEESRSSRSQPSRKKSSNRGGGSKRSTGGSRRRKETADG